MNRFTCILLVAALLICPVVSAQAATGALTQPTSNDALIQAQEALAAYRAQHRVVQVDLANGSKVTGHIGSIEKGVFYIVPPPGGSRGQRIRYSEVGAVTDSATGERLIQVGQLPKASVGGMRPGFKALVIVGVAAGVLLLVSYFVGVSRS